MRMLPIQPATALLSEIFIFHGKIRTENSWFPRWWFLDGYCVCGRVFCPDRDWQWTFPMPPTHPHHTHNHTGIEKWMKTGRKVKIFIFSSSSDWESRSTWWNRTHTDTRWWSFQFPPPNTEEPSDVDVVALAHVEQRARRIRGWHTGKPNGDFPNTISTPPLPFITITWNMIKDLIHWRHEEEKMIMGADDGNNGLIQRSCAALREDQRVSTYTLRIVRFTCCRRCTLTAPLVIFQLLHVEPFLWVWHEYLSYVAETERVELTPWRNGRVFVLFPCKILLATVRWLIPWQLFCWHGVVVMRMEKRHTKRKRERKNERKKNE